MMHEADYGFMGMHAGWWLFIVVLVALGFYFMSRRRKR